MNCASCGRCSDRGFIRRCRACSVSVSHEFVDRLEARAAELVNGTERDIVADRELFAQSAAALRRVLGRAPGLKPMVSNQWESASAGMIGPLFGCGGSK